MCAFCSSCLKWQNVIYIHTKLSTKYITTRLNRWRKSVREREWKSSNTHTCQLSAIWYAASTRFALQVEWCGFGYVLVCLFNRRIMHSITNDLSTSWLFVCVHRAERKQCCQWTGWNPQGFYVSVKMGMNNQTYDFRWWYDKKNKPLC